MEQTVRKKKRRCPYCGKPLETEDAFCSAQCREQYEAGDRRDSRQMPFFAAGMGLGFLLLLLGVFGNHPRRMGAGILLMGVTVTLFPFCTPDTLRMLGYRKSRLAGRAAGVFLAAVGVWMAFL